MLVCVIDDFQRLCKGLIVFLIPLADVASVQNKAERKALIDELKFSTKEVMNASIASNTNEPLYDWSGGVARLTAALESILSHCLKSIHLFSFCFKLKEHSS